MKSEESTKHDKNNDDSNHETMYLGELELVIVAPVDLSLASKLYIVLQTIPELRILHTMGSVRKGATITVALGKPMPLDEILASKLPEAEITRGLSTADNSEGDDYGLFRIVKKRVMDRIMFTSKRVPQFSTT